MKDKLFEEMAYNILEVYTRAYSKRDKDALASYLRTKFAVYRKQSEGKWRLTAEPLGGHDIPRIECSVCGDSWVLDGDFDFEDVLDYWHYCPTCGAQIKGGE
jgi:rubredoxin